MGSSTGTSSPTASWKAPDTWSPSCTMPASRSGTRRTCGSTTRSPLPPGAPTLTSTGRRPLPRSVRLRPGSGGSIWPGRGWGSTATRSSCTRFSGSSWAPPAGPACRSAPTGSQWRQSDSHLQRLQSDSTPKRGVGGLLVAVAVGHGEGQVERLAAVKPGVTGRLIALMQVVGDDLVTPADAFGDVVAGELDVNAARVSSGRAVHVEEGVQLSKHVVEPPGLVAARRVEGIAVHRVADPRDWAAIFGDRADKAGQDVANSAGAHPGDQREPAGLAAGIERGRQREQVVGGGIRAYLDPDRVADRARELDMCAVGRPCPLADPQEVRRRVVGPAGPRVQPGQRMLVVQQQGPVAGVELDCAQFLGVGAAGPPEAERPVDLAGQPLVPPASRAIGDEVLVPGVDLMQGRVTARGEGPAQGQRHGRALAS